MILNISVREKAHYLRSEFGALEFTEPVKFSNIPDGQAIVIVSGKWVQSLDNEEALKVALFESDGTTFKYFYMNASLVREMAAVE